MKVPYISDYITRYRQMSASGILGMNCRNIDFISRYNPRQLYPLVDDKLKTKKLALAHGVNVPELIGVIENQHDVNQIEVITANCSGFCIKPANGSGGKGIFVVSRNAEGQMCRTNGQPISVADLERHITNILAGLFSLGGGADVAMIESLIIVDPCMHKYTFEGVPDLRVIVFLGFPVMAMMRLSCSVSKGKANLHQGAVGVGIDIDRGRAVRAVQAGKTVTHHSDTGQDLSELVVPQWLAMLELACACYDMTGLGYLGVDLVLDKTRGPLLLELNARPGLSIQVANNAGLLPRLRFIEDLEYASQFNVSERVAFSRAHFSVQASAAESGTIRVGI
jgi:alpha-L-glutamate ligase-like protein